MKKSPYFELIIFFLVLSASITINVAQINTISLNKSVDNIGQGSNNMYELKNTTKELYLQNSMNKASKESNLDVDLLNLSFSLENNPETLKIRYLVLNIGFQINEPEPGAYLTAADVYLGTKKLSAVNIPFENIKTITETGNYTFSIYYWGPLIKAIIERDSISNLQFNVSEIRILNQLNIGKVFIPNYTFLQGIPQYDYEDFSLSYNGYSQSPIDEDNDGIYDKLKITFNYSSNFAGTYRFAYNIDNYKNYIIATSTSSPKNFSTELYVEQDKLQRSNGEFTVKCYYMRFESEIKNGSIEFNFDKLNIQEIIYSISENITFDTNLFKPFPSPELINSNVFWDDFYDNGHPNYINFSAKFENVKFVDFNAYITYKNGSKSKIFISLYITTQAERTKTVVIFIRSDENAEFINLIDSLSNKSWRFDVPIHPSSPERPFLELDTSKILVTPVKIINNLITNLLIQIPAKTNIFSKLRWELTIEFYNDIRSKQNTYVLLEKIDKSLSIFTFNISIIALLVDPDNFNKISALNIDIHAITSDFSLGLITSSDFSFGLSKLINLEIDLLTPKIIKVHNLLNFSHISENEIINEYRFGFFSIFGLMRSYLYLSFSNIIITNQLIFNQGQNVYHTKKIVFIDFFKKISLNTAGFSEEFREIHDFEIIDLVPLLNLNNISLVKGVLLKFSLGDKIKYFYIEDISTFNLHSKKYRIAILTDGDFKYIIERSTGLILQVSQLNQPVFSYKVNLINSTILKYATALSIVEESNNKSNTKNELLELLLGHSNEILVLGGIGIGLIGSFAFISYFKYTNALTPELRSKNKINFRNFISDKLKRRKMKDSKPKIHVEPIIEQIEEIMKESEET